MPPDDAARGTPREAAFSGSGGVSPLGVLTWRGRSRPNHNRGHSPQGAGASLAKDALDSSQQVLPLGALDASPVQELGERRAHGGLRFLLLVTALLHPVALPPPA
eukprot:4834042-Alexandrium_andersonii.AAC.1